MAGVSTWFCRVGWVFCIILLRSGTALHCFVGMNCDDNASRAHRGRPFYGVPQIMEVLGQGSGLSLPKHLLPGKEVTHRAVLECQNASCTLVLIGCFRIGDHRYTLSKIFDDNAVDEILSLVSDNKTSVWFAFARCINQLKHMSGGSGVVREIPHVASIACWPPAAHSTKTDMLTIPTIKYIRAMNHSFIKCEPFVLSEPIKSSQFSFDLIRNVFGGEFIHFCCGFVFLGTLQGRSQLSVELVAQKTRMSSVSIPTLLFAEGQNLLRCSNPCYPRIA